MTSGLLAGILVIAGILFALIAAVGTVRYRITGTGLEVLVLGRIVRRILLSDMEEVHRRGALVRESWSGPRFWNAVIIRRRSGWIRNVAISPDDPERFATRLREAIERSARGD